MTFRLILRSASIVAFGLAAGAAQAQAPHALPGELSPLAMFMQADVVVKSVMVSLALAAFAAWVILLAKKIELARLSRSLRKALDNLSEARHLTEATQNVRIENRICKAFVDAASDEIAFPSDDHHAVNERIGLRFQRIEAAALREAGQGIGILATISSAAPFVGLFGTVWGIMNSFIGISKAQTTNLAVVAPGIAEALLATAVGLVAAIPAVIFYNHLAKKLANYRIVVGDMAAMVSVLAGREITPAPRAQILRGPQRVSN